jgi:thiosulfate/3-mercaptopyruvate sulfurtransferase
MDGVSPLISVDELAATLGGHHVCDIRWDLTDRSKGRANHEDGHIPGAVFVDLDEDLSTQPGAGGRHPLPPIEVFVSTLGSLGIDPDTSVVVYDDTAGQIAARMWWMLRSIGHERVRLLDGGYQAWVAGGKEIAVGAVTPRPARYPVPNGYRGVATRDQLAGRTVIDARAPERYRGEFEPVDPKAGHIPKAVNIPSGRNLGDDGRFLDATRLEEVYAGIPSDAVVSCGSGVTACHDALALVLASDEMPDVYVGSFSEWSTLDLPVVTGPNP